MPMVTVIIPTRRRHLLLARALSSVLAQTHRELDIIIVDDNEPAQRIQLQASLAPLLCDSRIRILPNLGLHSAAGSRNCGLAAAEGDWVTYLDDDDEYRPDKVRQQLKLALTTGQSLVLCGAEFHLCGRLRKVQCGTTEWRGDDLILRARWNTPLLLHRHPGEVRFDESLSPGEDAEFAHHLLLRSGQEEVPVFPSPLVLIYPQSGERVNTNAEPLLRAASKILAFRRTSYSRAAKRRYLLQNLLAREKLGRRLIASTSLAIRLLIESRGKDWRACANAIMTASGLLPGRWVS